MNLHYHKWLNLEVTNNYFSNCVYPNFRVVPFSETSYQMKNFEILMKKESNSLSFYAGVAIGEDFTIVQDFKGLDNLYFQLINNDSLFFNYTDIPLNGDQKVYYFQNGINTDGSNLFQKSQFVSEIDLVSYKPKEFNIQLPNYEVNIEIKTSDNQSVKKVTVDGTKVKNYLLNLSHLDNGVFQIWLNDKLKETFFASSEAMAENCVGIIELNMPELISEYLSKLNYSIDFNTRSVYWRYEVVVRNSRKIQVTEMKVVGANKEVYNGPVEKQIIGGQTAQVFTTSEPIKMQNKLDQNPQLEMIYSNEFSNRQNQLDLKLPNPEAEQIKKINQGENKGLFCSSTIVYV